MGRVELHSPVLPFPIHKCWSFAPSIVHDEHCVRFRAHVTCSSPFRCQTETSSRTLSSSYETSRRPSARRLRSPEHGRGERHNASPLFRYVHLDGSKPVGPFVLVCVLGTTRRHQRCATALPPPPPSSRKVLLRPHSHSGGFESRGVRAPRTGHHSGAPRASQVIGSCRRLRHVASGCYPAGHSALPRPSRAKAVCSRFSPRDFRGQNTEASPYPRPSAFRRLAPSHSPLTGKPSRAFHS